MRFLALFVVAAWASCDTNTCLLCKQDPLCNWYGSGSFSDCRLNSSVPASLNLPIINPCPMCQAGNCMECKNQSGCDWYVASLGALGGQCGAAGATPNSSLPSVTYSAATTCPACIQYTTCDTCNAHQDALDNCGWYELPGGANGKCREASPGFAYTKVADGFCGGNICAVSNTCKGCIAVTNSSNATVCAWYNSKSPSLYNSKCDVDKVGVVTSSFYDKANTCPPCAGTTCVSCKAESGCDWLAVEVLGASSFGQCVTTGTKVNGKTIIGTCPATCKVYSCSACIGISECRWYTGSNVQDDSCDRATDSSQYPFSKAIAQGGTCPACKATRCFECNSESGCGWFRNTVPGLGTVIPGTGDCAPTAAPGQNTKLLPSTDSKCDGAPSGAAALVPGFAALLIAFFM